MITNYPKIYAIGKKEVKDVLEDPVIVEEKVDGSQISFGVYDGELVVKSRSTVLNLEDPDKMFNKAVDAIREREGMLLGGYTYRGEYLRKPRHNHLKYDNVPNGHIVIFDIMDLTGVPLVTFDKGRLALMADFSPVNTIYSGVVDSLEQLFELASGDSALGGKMEGVVIKNYHRAGMNSPWIFAKYVNDEYKETQKAPKLRSGTVEQIIEYYATEARYRKAIQHLADAGKLNYEMQDIPNLMREIGVDLYEEEAEAVKELLFSGHWKQIVKGVARGFPQFWKNYLEKRAFDGDL
jgi:hypothetical protein